MHFLNTILDIIFPIKCVFCGQNGVDLCEKCLKGARSAERESAKWIFPVFDYRDPVIKKSLWFLKYKGKRRLAKIFAEAIYEKMQEELSELILMENFNNTILIPIPLSPKRKRERGFNQAELICGELIKINKETSITDVGIPQRVGVGLLQSRIPTPAVTLTLDCDILLKPRETEHQARIKDRRERMKNIAGTFAVQNEEKIKTRNIILVDDILTTGATLNEAKKILKKAGARKIIAFTVAH
jgi:predicted amidophosphoribosyltransferase